MDEMTAFKRDLLRELYRHGPIHGLGIKEILDEKYSGDINHGRLYPNLDQMADSGLINKNVTAIDDRTHQYELTEEGRNLVEELAEEWTL